MTNNDRPTERLTVKCCAHARDDHDRKTGQCEILDCKCNGWGRAPTLETEVTADMFRLNNEDDQPCIIVNQARQVDIIGPVSPVTICLMALRLAELTMPDEWDRIEVGLCPVCGEAPAHHATGFPAPADPKRWIVRCGNGHAW